jgi:hypothetical protein
MRPWRLSLRTEAAEPPPSRRVAWLCRTYLPLQPLALYAFRSRRCHFFLGMQPQRAYPRTMIFKHLNPEWLPYLVAMSIGIAVALVLGIVSSLIVQ